MWPNIFFMTFTFNSTFSNNNDLFTSFEKGGSQLQYTVYSADLSWYLPRLLYQSLLTWNYKCNSPPNVYAQQLCLTCGSLFYCVMFLSYCRYCSTSGCEYVCLAGLASDVLWLQKQHSKSRKIVLQICEQAYPEMYWIL